MPTDVDAQLIGYLQDAHAMEMQSIQMLEQAVGIAGDMQLAQLYRGHLNDTRDHERYVKQRLEEIGQSTSSAKNLAGKGAAMAIGALAQAMPDTPARLAGVAFAYESFEVAAYEMLRKVAQVVGDGDTVAMCERIIPSEKQAAHVIEENLDLAVQRTLERTAEIPGQAVGEDPGPHA